MGLGLEELRRGSRLGRAVVWVSAWAWVCTDLDLGVVAWWLTIGNGFGFADLDLGLPISAT
uniref:Uncharacterized protein n=1 Tax=Fagus sylvatica TaxID=28930 RepID=A0A2N9G8C6_FAGSY